MRADRRRPRIASAQVVSADADVGETLNRPERGVVHFYAEVFGPLVGKLAVNSPGSVGWKFARPADKPHSIAQLSVKQIIGNFVIWFHRPV